MFEKKRCFKKEEVKRKQEVNRKQEKEKTAFFGKGHKHETFNTDATWYFYDDAVTVS